MLTQHNLLGTTYGTFRQITKSKTLTGATWHQLAKRKNTTWPARTEITLLDIALLDLLVPRLAAVTSEDNVT